MKRFSYYLDLYYKTLGYYDLDTYDEIQSFFSYIPFNYKLDDNDFMYLINYKSQNEFYEVDQNELSAMALPLSNISIKLPFCNVINLSMDKAPIGSGHIAGGVYAGIQAGSKLIVALALFLEAYGKAMAKLEVSYHSTLTFNKETGFAEIVPKPNTFHGFDYDLEADLQLKAVLKAIATALVVFKKTFTDIFKDCNKYDLIALKDFDVNNPSKTSICAGFMVLKSNFKTKYLFNPNTISKNLVDWASKNKKNKSDKEYLRTITKTFANGSYFYNLSPKNLSQNNYADFFFNSKEGYCEYFAGTFVLLARLGGIPSRIVSGYLGGDLNNIGDFYLFRQKDAHAWAEVWFEKEGWVRVDPTKYIPQENIRNTLNDLFNYKKNTSDSSIRLKIFKYVGYYLNYTDFVWTQHLLSYDNAQRKSFIKDLTNFTFSKTFYWIFIPILSILFVRFLFLFNKKKFIKLVINFVIWKLRKKYNLLYSDTHQQILNKLSVREQNKYKNLFEIFEIVKYSNNEIRYSLIFKSLI